MNVRTKFQFSALGLFFARTPFIPTFRFVQRLRVGSSSNLKSRISGSLPNMWNDEILVRREAPVLLPVVGGFQFGRRPKVLLAVFVRLREAPVLLRNSPPISPHLLNRPLHTAASRSQLIARRVYFTHTTAPDHSWSAHSWFRTVTVAVSISAVHSVHL